jgi:glycogen operon protein
MPFSSINLVTAHDGFTLRDLVSYDHKHNEANKEDNRDGSDNNISWNCGAEGPTDDPEINRLRARQQRNFLATLFLSQGTPMLLSGDEYGRTQGGNNNAYCQDNAISWFDWQWGDEQRKLFDFTRRAIALRREHPVLHRAKFFKNRPIRYPKGSTTVRDIMWFRHDGAEMSDEDWNNPETQSLALFLAGRGIDDVDERGRPLTDDDFLLLVNASPIDLPFQLPEGKWHIVLDTFADRTGEVREPTCVSEARSLQLLQRDR